MAERRIQDYEKVLIVEGYSDLRFYAELLEHLDKHDEVFIKQFTGKADLKLQLNTFINAELLQEKKSIGVIVDADDNPAGTVQSLCERLTKITGISVTKPQEWSGEEPRIGLMVVPSASSEGEIETLVWDAWSNDQRNADRLKCVRDFEACMSIQGITAKSPDKGLISALLAFHNDEDPRLGPGAQARVFDFDRPEFHALREFLSKI